MSTVPFTPKKDAERPDESTLTDRQRKVLGAIKKHLVEQGFAPSFREIGEAVYGGCPGFNPDKCLE